MNSTSYESAEAIRQHSLAQVIKTLEQDGKFIFPAEVKADLLAMLRQCEIDAPSDNVKARYPDFIAMLTSSHARSTANTYSQEARSIGMKDNIQMRVRVAGIGNTSLRMGMILGALMRERGLDPIEVLLRHCESQTKKSGAAHELRMVENAYDQYQGFLDTLVAELEEPAPEPDAGAAQE